MGYWSKEGACIVIVEHISPDYLVITSFHIDDQKMKTTLKKDCSGTLRIENKKSRNYGNAANQYLFPLGNEIQTYCLPRNLCSVFKSE